VIGWSWHGRHGVRQRHPNKPVDDLIRSEGRNKKETKKQKLLTNISRWTWRETGFSVYHTRNPARRLPLILGHAVVNEDGRFRVQNRVEIVRHFLPVSPLFEEETKFNSKIFLFYV
jgi:hypothetical protein